MKVKLHKKFEKKLSKLSKKQKKQCIERLKLFIVDPFNEKLNNHALKGRRKESRSINITGDIRAVYKMQKNNIAFFIDLDTHSNLYS